MDRAPKEGRHDQRREVRVKLHRGVALEWSQGHATGQSENLSERGAMITVEPDPGLRRGDRVTLRFDLPGLAHPCVTGAQVRWCSTVLPGLIGLEFDAPLDGDAAKLLELLARDAEGPVP